MPDQAANRRADNLPRSAIRFSAARSAIFVARFCLTLGLNARVATRRNFVDVGNCRPPIVRLFPAVCLVRRLLRVKRVIVQHGEPEADSDNRRCGDLA
jgi:hypothetical protein